MFVSDFFPEPKCYVFYKFRIKEGFLRVFLFINKQIYLCFKILANSKLQKS